MRKFYFALWAMVALCTFSNAQVQVVPKWFNANDTISIYYNSSDGNAALSGISPVYAHMGLITSSSASSSDWRHTIGNWGTQDANTLMQAVAGNMHTKRYHIGSFHSLPQGESLQKLAFVFRNQAGTIVGRASSGSDILVDAYQGPFQSAITLNGSGPVSLSANGSAMFRGEASKRAGIRFKLNGAPIVTRAQNKFVETTLHGNNLSAGQHTLTLEVDTGTGYFQTASVQVVKSSGVVAQPVPAGMEDGITVITPNSVHLQLRAPGKPWAFVLGDFNNWQLDSAYLMTPTPDGQTFWIQIDSLNPQTRYRFQYYVGPLGTRIADPYSELILDPWNDHHIDQATFPNRPFYPAGQSGLVGVFQTGATDYQWDNSIQYQRPDNRDLVIYELLVRDFDERHTWQALIDRMDYFEKLQINAIQLMPVMEFEGNESWGYNPSYMLATDKYYGPAHDLKRFIEECHRRGIAVILDITLNHQFGQSPLCQLYWDAQNNQPATDNPWMNPVARHPYNVGYDMNHDSPHTQYFSKRVFKYWLEEFKVDGFRVDMSKGFTQNNTLGNVGGWNAYDQARINRLTDYGQYIWGITPGAYIILEHFADNSEESALSNNGFMLWGDMNYSYTQAVMGFASDLGGALASNRGWWGKNLVAYMESHDEERAVFKAKMYGNSTVGHNTRDINTAISRNAMASALLFATPGPKMIWQFGELGYDYSIDFCPDSTISNGCHLSNKPIRWDYFEDPVRRAAFNQYADMIYLRKTQPAFRNDPIDYFVGSLVKTIRLQDGNRHFIVVANTDVAAQSPSTYFPVTGKWYSLFESDSIQVGSNFHGLNLAPGEFKVFCNHKIPLPNAPFSPDLLPDFSAICNTSGELLTAAPGFGPYTWSNGNTGQSISVSQNGWYKVSIANAFGAVYSDSTYVMIDCLTPAVATYTPELITANSAKFSGQLVSNGASSVSAVGFVYGTSPNPTLANSNISLATTTGVFTGSPSNLLPGITYYVRSFATNSGGTAYGNTQTFTTASNNFDLTFRVDMRNESISPNGVFVAGDFQQLAGFTNNWDASACQMLDLDGDSIYEFTATLPNGNYAYKFINGNSWAGSETVPAACASGLNRTVNLSSDLSTAPVCFGSCSPCDTNSTGLFNLTFKVDMSQVSVHPAGVHIAGNFQALAGYASDWNPALTALTDANNDGIYEITLALPAGTYEYKFINGNTWGSDESVPLACNTNGNRSFTLSADMGTPAACFGSCTPCFSGPLPNVDVTFQVDMSNTIVSANGVHIAGNFQNAAGFGADWNPASSAMSDADGDGIYSLTVNIPAGTYQYKFVNGNAWGADEAVPAACATGFNREFTATGNTTLPAVCFAGCGTCSSTPPQTLYTLTFRVDMSQQSTISPLGVFVVGDFQSEAGFGSDWNPAGSPMADANGDGIWELTVQVPAGIYEYKFLNGNTWLNEESVPGYCSYGGNRGLVLTGDTALPEVCFSACEPCAILPPSAYTVTFRVDMRNEIVSPNGVHIAGNFLIAAGLDSVHWRANGVEMLDTDGDTIYEISLQIPVGVYEYKFVNGNIWGNEEQISGACVSGFNRVLMVNTNRDLPAVCFESCGPCQIITPPSFYALTFRVNMQGQTVNPLGVHIAGDFQALAGFGSDWNPASTPLTDADGDSIYEVTVNLPAGTYEYKFVNGNAWGSDEALLGLPCATAGNRSLTLSTDSTLAAVCFQSCSPCIPVTPPSSFNLTFKVDMRDQTVSANGVHIAGNFQEAAGYASNWDPAITPLTDANGDGIYEITLNLPVGTYEYKFVNGNAWGSDENMWSQACQVNGNRSISLVANTTLPAYCFGSCAICPNNNQTFNVSFHVDLNGICEVDSVEIAGTMNAWAGGNWLSDADGDGVYSITLNLAPGTYDYKFRRHFNGTLNWEGVANRLAIISSDSSLNVVCFNSLSACSGVIPPADVTFRVDLNGLTADSAGVWVMGDFTSPAWQQGAILLSPTSDPDVFETTLSVCPSTFYWKFVNGNPVSNTNDETFPNGDSSCYVSNGLGGLNRITTRTNGQPLLLSYIYNSCNAPTQTSLASVSTAAAVNISSQSAELGGDVLTDGGLFVSARGVVYDLNPQPDLSNTFTQNGTGIGVFSSPVSGLLASTTYYYRAYATNALGTAFGTEMQFTTLSSGGGPITCNAHNLSSVAGASGHYNQRFNWTAIVGASEHRLQYRMVGNGSWSGVNELGTQRLIQNLSPGDYEARVYGVGLGDTSCVITFTIGCASDIGYATNVFQAAYLNALPASSARVTVFNVSGGKSLYNFELENLSTGNINRVDARRNQTYSQLAGGNYALRVYDAYNCQADSVTPIAIDALDTAYIPNLISAVNSSPNGFRPLWNRPRQNGQLSPGVLSYQLRVRNETDNQLVNLYTGIADTFFNVNNLTPGKLYRFNVRSRYNPGSGARNSAFSIRRDRSLGAGGNKEEGGAESAELIRIYPNPTADVVYVESPLGSKLELFDLQGRLLQTHTAQGPVSSIDLSAYAKGSYILEIEHLGQISRQKVVKQ